MQDPTLRCGGGVQAIGPGGDRGVTRDDIRPGGYRGCCASTDGGWRCGAHRGLAWEVRRRGLETGGRPDGEKPVRPISSSGAALVDVSREGPVAVKAAVPAVSPQDLNRECGSVVVALTHVSRSVACTGGAVGHEADRPSTQRSAQVRGLTRRRKRPEAGRAAQCQKARREALTKTRRRRRRGTGGAGRPRQERGSEGQAGLGTWDELDCGGRWPPREGGQGAGRCCYRGRQRRGQRGMLGTQ